MKTGTCDYCSAENVEVQSTVYLADVDYRQRGAVMCKGCWDHARETGLVHEGIYIPEFEDTGEELCK